MIKKENALKITTSADISPPEETTKKSDSKKNSNTKK